MTTQESASNPAWTTASVRNVTVLLMTLVVSLLFVGVVRDYLMAMLLAAILAGVAQPVFRTVLRVTKGRRGLAAAITMTLLILLVLLPLAGLVAIVVGEAFQVSEEIIPWFKQQLKNPDALRFELPSWMSRNPELDLSSYDLAPKLGELAGKAGNFLLQSLSKLTQGTASLLLELFIMLYAMFFFLKDGVEIRDKILYLLPLTTDIKERLIQKGLSVTRATIKGTMVIGLIQGTLAGLAYLVAGVPAAILWGVVTAVASVIPALGTTLVWAPVVLYLFISGHTAAAIGVAIWCAAVVGSIDNILRPRLVGNDTQMPDLLILISTLGGLSLFGAVGLLIGPIVAALCVTMWDICGLTFRGYLHDGDDAKSPT
jgi:predicted PurR-regulated permease PerM